MRSCSSTTAVPGRCRWSSVASRRSLAATAPLADGERRLRALTEALATGVIPESDLARRSTRTRVTLRDIDTPRRPAR